MSRTLPLGTSESKAESTPVAAMPDAPALTGTVSVFDPAMCCPTGLCGPGVDPALMQVARDLRWLTAHGATVERFGLSQEPQAFTANARVAGLLQAFGDQALPAVLANGTILTHGRYPSRDELVAALTVAPGPSAAELARPARGGMMILGDADASACAPGSGCC
jgi:hypothetical protein